MSTARPHALAAVAKRDNPLRRNVFVSPVLGKHVPVHPDLAALAGASLGLLYAGDARAGLAVDALLSRDQLRATRLLRDLAINPAVGGEEVTVIGFAETATALAHAAASAINAALYVHTTRNVVRGRSPLLEFRENHSHAPSHTLYGPAADRIPVGSVLLVDDEVTTGETAVNLIAQLRPIIAADRYVLATLIEHLGLAGHDRLTAAGAALGCTFSAIAVAPAPTLDDRHADGCPALRPPSRRTNAIKELQILDVEVDTLNTPLDGRLGLGRQDRAALERLAARAAHQLATIPYGPPNSYLGVGEFLYLPMRVAAFAGKDARFWATTRSPILAQQSDGYPIRTALTFPGPDCPDIPCYLYNLDPVLDRRICVVFDSRSQRSNAAGLINALGAAGVTEVACLTFCTPGERRT